MNQIRNTLNNINFSSSYEVGQRIRLISMGNDPYPIESGTEGIITSVTNFSDWAQIGVRWDNGRALMVCLPEDKITIIGGVK